MQQQPRPERTYATGPATRVLRLAALVGVAAIAAWLLARYPSMPDIVPTHFGTDGTADDWGSKSSVLWLVGVMVALALLLAGISARPRRFNYPTVVTEQNAQQLYREGERTLVWMLVAMAVVFAGLAQLVTGDAGPVLLVLGLLGIVAAPLAGLIRMLGATGPSAR